MRLIEPTGALISRDGIYKVLASSTIGGVGDGSALSIIECAGGRGAAFFGERRKNAAELMPIAINDMTAIKTHMIEYLDLDRSLFIAYLGVSFFPWIGMFLY